MTMNGHMRADLQGIQHALRGVFCRIAQIVIDALTGILSCLLMDVRQQFLRYQLYILHLANGVDKQHCNDREASQDNKGYLEVLLELPTEINGVKAAFLETGRSIFTMMMVMMMMLLFGHNYFRML